MTFGILAAYIVAGMFFTFVATQLALWFRPGTDQGALFSFFVFIYLLTVVTLLSS
jgi:hypothetical protein